MATTEQVIEGLRKVKEAAPVTTHARIEKAIERLQRLQAELDQVTQERDRAVNMPAWVLDNGT